MATMRDPAIRATAVTPSDTTDLGAPRWLYVGVTGDVAIQMHGDDAAVTHTAVPAGTVLPVRAKRVFATGTTASGIVAWY